MSRLKKNKFVITSTHAFYESKPLDNSSCDVTHYKARTTLNAGKYGCKIDGAIDSKIRGKKYMFLPYIYKVFKRTQHLFATNYVYTHMFCVAIMLIMISVTVQFAKLSLLFSTSSPLRSLPLRKYAYFS